MALKPHPDEAGLWINDDLQPGNPGVHALIIGVSRYDYLAGGALTKNMAETYGLGQLAVSALTALRFFEWLRCGYVLKGWPVAQVRLLLSPQRQRHGEAKVDELAGCDPDVVAHAPEATFDLCKSAIRSWYAQMKQLKPPARGRSLVFFSGHGMQISRANQLLLPSDYGRPDGGRDEVIRTQNLFECLSSLAAVPAHVVLLDACRNDIEALRKVVGTNVIDESDSDGDPRLELRVLRATAYGARAYQPTSPGGMSLFGQALLDGLRAQPDPRLDEPAIAVSKRGAVSTIEINDLHSYMNGRIDALIKAASESVVQIVRADDSQSAAARIDVTELVDPKPAETAEIGDLLIEETYHDLMFEAEGADDEAGTMHVEADPTPPPSRSTPRRHRDQRPGAWFAKRYGAQKLAATGLPNIGDLHSVLGAEAFAIPWMDLRIEGLSTGRSPVPAELRLVSAAQSTHEGNLHGIQAHVRVEPLKKGDPVGYALTMQDRSGQSFCAILPADRETFYFMLEIDRIDRAYIRLATYLSSANEGDGGRAAAAWEKMRAVGAPAAAKLLGKGFAAEGAPPADKDRVKSPLAAIVDLALLLRANRFDLMEDRARNLAMWFGAMPDGVVFWMEQCLRTRRAEVGRDATAWFAREMLARSLPFTCDGLGMAANIAGEIERERLPADSATRKAVARLLKRIESVMPYFRDDGLFCAYAGLPDGWNAATLLGLSKSRSVAPSPAPFDGPAHPARTSRRWTS